MQIPGGGQGGTVPKLCEWLLSLESLEQRGKEVFDLNLFNL
jgi:hypothetical protein